MFAELRLRNFIFIGGVSPLALKSFSSMMISELRKFVFSTLREIRLAS